MLVDCFVTWGYSCWHAGLVVVWLLTSFGWLLVGLVMVGSISSLGGGFGSCMWVGSAYCIGGVAVGWCLVVNSVGQFISWFDF